ncbi:MAG: UDP-N-acetylmuramoyl-L-alanine--D-glutamate ligase [Clostridia bacterium]|nr:UDP-N-acetylmuramoyl-L-alanine--D-glutamate ligase [Clostridia bacterium]
MEKNFIFKGKRICRVGFFGLGKSNEALYEYLKRHYEGLSFILRSDIPIKQSQFEVAKFGSDAMTDICEDVLFLSPSVRGDRPEFASAKAAGTLISSDVEFFFEKSAIPTISVTGTDGKSTTATMASLMLTDTLGPFPATANIGIPITSVLDDIDTVGTVAELSSFQLMNFEPISRRAVITNVSENHLDWHTSFDEYISAKENVLKKARERVFNLDCKICSEFAKKYPAYAVYSMDMSLSEMKNAVDAEHYFHFSDGALCVCEKKLIDCQDISFRERYNRQNFLAAVALCHGLANKRSIERVAKGFKPLAHRAELVFERDGISFYDSSVDSTPARTKATVSAFKSPIILILGGKGKNLSYTSLFPLSRHVKAIVISGENRAELQKALFTQKEVIYGKISVFYAEFFTEAVTTAISLAKSGDSVLLSPASTSFDRFKNYSERGNTFTDIIKKYYAAK